MATATKTKVTFITPRHDQRLVIEPEDYAQRDARNRILVDYQPAKAIQFEGGQYETDDPEEIKFLRKHNLFQNLERGFWELDAPPDEPKPTTAEQIDVIAIASASHDAGTLRALIKEEEATHKRAPILSAAHKALDRITNDTAPKAEAEGTGQTAEAEGDSK